jgi:GT2 family glycosyltransferase
MNWLDPLTTTSAQTELPSTQRSTAGVDVAVILCTKDRPEELERALASIRASCESAKQAEIVVVEEAERPRLIPGVKYVHLPREGRGFGYARNRGMEAITRDIVVFIDDDCEAERGWLDALLAPLVANPGVVGVAGAVLVRETGLIGHAESILGFPGGGLRYLDAARGRVIPINTLSTCNCAYRREAVLRAGGFLETARLGAEDSLLADRVQSVGPCVYAPQAIVYHRARGRLISVFRWFIRRGQSEIGYLHSTDRPWRSRWYLLRGSWALRLVALTGGLVLWPMLLLALPAVLLSYYLLLLWRFRYAQRYPRYRQAWWVVPFVKFTMDLGAEVGRWTALRQHWRGQ